MTSLLRHPPQVRHDPAGRAGLPADLPAPADVVRGGAPVRAVPAANSLLAGLEGVVVGWYVNTQEVLVRTPRGAIVTVPAQLLEPSSRPAAA